MELQLENLKGVGLDLVVLEKVIKDLLDLSTAEVRFDARHKPIRVRWNYNDCPFVVTEITMDKDGLILTIDPEF